MRHLVGNSTALPTNTAPPLQFLYFNNSLGVPEAAFPLVFIINSTSRRCLWALKLHRICSGQAALRLSDVFIIVIVLICYQLAAARQTDVGEAAEEQPLTEVSCCVL